MTYLCQYRRLFELDITAYWIRTFQPIRAAHRSLFKQHMAFIQALAAYSAAYCSLLEPHFEAF
ncbi:MAG: hypothetical protein ACK518_04060 [bacterium]